jgi:CARDB
MIRERSSPAGGALLTAFTGLSLLAVAALAQMPQSQYAVKFICGKSEGTVVAPGQYFTAINVHNPNEAALAFRKKFAVALPGERPGRVSQFFDARLGPDQAFEIDCPDILRRLDMNGFVKGFAVIESPQELDVVAVYTAAGATGRVETMEIERVKPRNSGTVGGKPDLIPLPDPATGSFCRIKDGTLTVTVKNQGTGPAGQSTTTVTFAAGPVPLLTMPIGPGGQLDVHVPVPANCFQPDCGFKIMVDSGLVVDETNEANNTATGACPG